MKHEVNFIKEEKILFPFLEVELEKVFQPGSRVLIKLHMGEPGNPNFINASFTGKIAEILEAIGCKPAIFDTPVVYRSRRDNVNEYMRLAAEHGFSEEKINAPVIISNDAVNVRGEHMNYEVASIPMQADGILLLSHFKGHMASGMGGAIKNVGMGCMSKKTKGEIHTGGEPVYNEGCTQCNACVEACPTDNIRIDDDKPSFDCTWCAGCSNCILVCPEECMSPRVEIFDRLLAEAAVLAHNRFKKVFALNVLKKITQLCDCMSDPGPYVADDIGYICGKDMLSVDIASLDILKKVTGVDDLFAEYNKHSSWEHVRAAAEMMNRNMEVSIKEFHQGK